MAKANSALEVSVLLLAAGSSERMGEKNKLLLPVNGEAMVLRAMRASCHCGADSVCLVTGFERKRILALAEPFNLSEVFNPNFKLGQDRSIYLGLEKLHRANRSVLVMLADQPGVDAEMLSALITAHRLDGGMRALVPTYREQWGTPRVIPASLVEQAVSAKGALSMRQVLADNPKSVQRFDVDDAAVLLDIDTPADYLTYPQQ